MQFLSRSTQAVLLLTVLGLVAAGPVMASNSFVTMKIVEDGVRMAETDIVVYLSYDKIEVTTDAQGLVTFPVKTGAGFWLEVNGERVAQFFRQSEIVGEPYTVDVAVIGTMPWPSGTETHEVVR